MGKESHGQENKGKKGSRHKRHRLSNVNKEKIDTLFRHQPPQVASNAILIASESRNTHAARAARRE